MNKLTEEIKIAIAHNDVDKIIKLINICDTLHRGMCCENYEIEDIPSDNVYEELKHKYEQLISVGKISQQLLAETVYSSYYKAKPKKKLSEFYMDKDAIEKSNYAISKIFGNDIIVMPKYDGVSCCIKFERKDDRFVITKARTRGVDVGLINNNTDMTERICQIIYSDNCSWIKKFNSLTKQFKSITVRGEIVLVKKLPTPSAPYVAGKINSKFENIDPEKVIGFKMFELTRCEDDEHEYVLSQSKVCKTFRKIDESLVYEIIHLNNNQEINNRKLLEIYDKWNRELSSPIDGIVYCKTDWKYPLFKEETGVNYNKFALKPYESLTSKLTDIVYNIGKDGRLVPIINFEEVVTNYRKYKQAKSTIGNIRKMILNKNLSIGSIINISFPGNIPFIDDCVENDKSDKLITIPTKCPFCSSELESIMRKDTVILECNNIMCPGILTKRVLQLMKNIKAKGIGESKIKNAIDSYTDNFVLVFEELDKQAKKKDYIKSLIYESEISGLFIGLDIFTATAIKKDVTLSPIINNKVIDELITVKSVLQKYCDDIIVDTVLEII